MNTMVYNSAQGARMIGGVLRRAPHAHDAKIAAAAFLIVVRTIQFAPSVTATHLKPPAVPLDILQGFLDVPLRVFVTRHVVLFAKAILTVKVVK